MSKKEQRKAPVLRFKGFTDDWELHKLDEIVKFYGGLTYHPENIQEDGTLVLRSSNIHNNQIVLKDTVHVSPEIVNTSNVNVNDIIVVVRNATFALWWGECSHCYLPLFLNSTLYIFYRECVNTSECIRTAYPPLLYQTPPLCYLLQVEPFAYPAYVSCCSPIVLSLRR